MIGHDLPMARVKDHFLILLVSFLCSQLIQPDACDGALTSDCSSVERSALLEFKQGLKDPSKRLISWKGEECCTWDAVTCNDHGHVIKLDLRNPHPFSDNGGLPYNKWRLGGELRPSLLVLKHLKYLDLSMNNFGGTNVPKFMGSFHQLKYLNLSRAGLGGLLPHELGNLSSLQYLDLRNDLDPDSVVPIHELRIDDALWISRLSSLKYLNMQNVKFRRGTRWLQALNMLPSIVEIHLPFCEIEYIPHSLPHVNFTLLSVLDLSYNSITSTMPTWLFNISGLEYLYLSENRLHGHIPPALGNLASLKDLNLAHNPFRQGGLPSSLRNLCQLQKLNLTGINVDRDLSELDEVFSGCIKTSIEVLDLCNTGLSGQLPKWLWELIKLKSLRLVGNQISGPIPASIGLLASLQELSFSDNRMNGTIPESIGWLSELITLDLRLNSLVGEMSEAHFGDLKKLKHLCLSSNSLVLKVMSNWLPPFRLEFLHMDSCILGSRFPGWLQMQENISYIKMSKAGISDAMPDWFWSLISSAWFVDISGNQISGQLSNLLHINNLRILDLSSNCFEGRLPYFPSGLEVLDLSNNSFSGSILPGIIISMPSLTYLSLAENMLSGEIPSSVCRLHAIVGLDLSRNLLSGELPNCWNHSSRTVVLDFSSNNISGGIPESICSLSSLESLHLSDNSLSGELPFSLKYCKGLLTLDIGYNEFKGKIPTWIGERLISLKILKLRSNMFDGEIPPNLSKLSSLQILDLGNNELLGTIPLSFGNFSAMKVTRNLTNVYNSRCVEMLMTIKGITQLYDKLLSLLNLLDLSGNDLYGEIPGEITSLSGLISLNLSRNHLTGEITEKIGALRQLESLDLSSNSISGAIPSSLTSLTSLASLNLSHNNLSGEIPLGNQLLTFGASSFVGNPGLCGLPLNQSCNGSETSRGQDSSDGDGNELIWIYVSIAPGFALGFWAVWGTLILKKNWNLCYCRFIDNMLDKVYVFVMLNRSRI